MADPAGPWVPTRAEAARWLLLGGGGRRRGADRALEGADLRAAVADAVRAELERFEAELDELRTAAITDPLTSLYNRRHFDTVLPREVSRATRYDRALTILLLDLDDLKHINDRGGHLAGDAALTELAARMGRCVRSPDTAYRIGGDEFAIILAEATTEDAARVYARLRASLDEMPRDHDWAPLSISAGAASLVSGESAGDLFRRADEELYRAKAAGKGGLAAGQPRRQRWWP